MAGCFVTVLVCPNDSRLTNSEDIEEEEAEAEEAEEVEEVEEVEEAEKAEEVEAEGGTAGAGDTFRESSLASFVRFTEAFVLSLAGTTDED